MSEELQTWWTLAERNRELTTEVDLLREEKEELKKVLALMTQRYGYETCEYVRMAQVLLKEVDDVSNRE